MALQAIHPLLSLLPSRWFKNCNAHILRDLLQIVISQTLSNQTEI